MQNAKCKMEHEFPAPMLFFTAESLRRKETLESGLPAGGWNLFHMPVQYARLLIFYPRTNDQEPRTSLDSLQISLNRQLVAQEYII